MGIERRFAFSMHGKSAETVTTDRFGIEGAALKHGDWGRLAEWIEGWKKGLRALDPTKGTLSL